jgi:hypothetical protein
MGEGALLGSDGQQKYCLEERRIERRTASMLAEPKLMQC